MENNISFLQEWAHDIETLYGSKVLHFIRTQKLDHALWDTFALHHKDNSFLEGAYYLLSKFGQLDLEEISPLNQINHSIVEIVERVTELSSISTLKSHRKTISFINQVLFEEMGFQWIAFEDQSLEHFYIDQVRQIIFMSCAFHRIGVMLSFLLFAHIYSAITSPKR